ncbi:hypothetical protein [Poseidonibacter lekithochrous]|uniref:hypothetical protein n=1 Tax=Poseidonibacter lekithochrous TaxID=1904463 RepID=UPI0008FCB783|nr:hypothetical protein [Poseidonibacter lekithochrous]QKJ22460.1 hypothetical protein ALEK_1181 [Poseidonibacter lekithochrous]
MKKDDLDNELSMDKIEDYNGKESKEKRNTVRIVIIVCLVFGAVFAYLKTTSLPNDYVGTTDKPGINTSKK